MSDVDVERALTAVQDAPMAVPPPSAEMERLLATTRPASPRRPIRDVLRTMLASSICAAAVVALLGVRIDLRDLPVAWIVGAGILWLATFIGAVLASVLPSRTTGLPRVTHARALSVASIVLSIGVGLAAAQHGMHSVLSHTSMGLFMTRAWPCVLLAFLVGVVPATLAVVALRRAAPVGDAWIGAAVGAAGGALGGLVLHMHCPVADRWHVGLVHGGAVLLMGIVVSLVARRWLRP